MCKMCLERQKEILYNCFKKDLNQNERLTIKTFVLFK